MQWANRDSGNRPTSSGQLEPIAAKSARLIPSHGKIFA